MFLSCNVIWLLVRDCQLYLLIYTPKSSPTSQGVLLGTSHLKQGGNGTVRSRRGLEELFVTIGIVDDGDYPKLVYRSDILVDVP